MQHKHEIVGRLARRPAGFFITKGALQGARKLYVYVAFWLSSIALGRGTFFGFRCALVITRGHLYFFCICTGQLQCF